MTRGRAWLRLRWDALNGELRIEGEFSDLPGMTDAEFENALEIAASDLVVNPQNG